MFQIILSPNVKVLTGSLSRKDGFYIKHRKNGFFVYRKPPSVHRAPLSEDAYWQYMVRLAEMAGGFVIEDIRITANEIEKALLEAHYFVAGQRVRSNAEAGIKYLYDARDILNLKITFGL